MPPQHYTTIATIIEDSVGIKLAPENMNQYGKIDKNSLKILYEALSKYEASDYVMPIISDNDEPIFAVFDESAISISLGSVGQGTRFAYQFTFSPEQMLGRLKMLLILFPRIAIRDGLTYYLDTIYVTNLKNEDAGRRILQFYCVAGDLIKNGTLIIIPRKFYMEHGNAPSIMGEDRLWMEIQKKLQGDPGIRDSINGLRERIVSKQGQDSEDSAEDAGNRAIELIMGQHQRSFRRLLQFISFYRNYNYFAVVDNKYHEIMLHHALTELYPKSHAGSSVIIHDVLLPRFEKLPFSELLAARGSDAFKEMRFVIKDIFHDISKYQDQPLKLSEFINDRLNHGKKHVEDAVRSSTYLSELRSDLGKFSIGVVVSSVVPIPGVEKAFFYILGQLGLVFFGAAGVKRMLSSRKVRASKNVSILFASLLEIPDQ